MSEAPLIWEWMIGHYGDYYVMVAAENFERFRRAFPKAVFPKKVKTKSVSENIADSSTEIAFDSAYPRSRGRFYEIRFADGTKGERVLEDSGLLQSAGRYLGMS